MSDKVWEYVAFRRVVCSLKRKRGIKKKTVFLVLIIGGLAAAGFWYVTENDRADKAEAYRRHQADAALCDSKVTEDEVDAELGLYCLFIERSRTKLSKN